MSEKGWTPAHHKAMRELVAEMGAMGATDMVHLPHVCITLDVPVDDLDDPTDPGIHFVVGPFPTATEALAYAEQNEKRLNEGCGDKPMFRVIAVPITEPDYPKERS